MAYATLVSLLHITDEFLDFDDFDLRFFPFTKGKFLSFHETIQSLMAFLDNCPPVCSQRVNDLIAEIRVASYKAEYFLDSWKLKGFPEFGYEQIIEKLELINIEVSKIQLGGSDVHALRISALAGSVRSATLGNDTNKVALDNDLKMKLLERLEGGRSGKDIIPIVGMGGIGKTILARILYNDQRINETFDIRAWDTISQTYDVQEIVKNILGVILKDNGECLDEIEDVKLHLYKTLCGRRYLIVLDDVWDTQAWDNIKVVFPEDNNGSRILLTTRDLNVAAYVDSFTTFHEMHPLNGDSSWSLLCQEIFLQDNCPSELVEIGKEIARQCQGLPLAISAIGGHLKKEKTEEYWKHVSENITSVLNTNIDPSLEILALSYNYLPHYLKPCFLYFGSFEEDYIIHGPTIVKMWVAEGFVAPSRSKTMEEVAEEYLNDIIDRNLVILHDCDPFGNPETCGIHDLFRDICIREVKKEKFLCILNKNISLNHMEIYSQRRLILSRNIKNDVESVCNSIVSRDGSFPATRSSIFHGEIPLSSTFKLAPGLLKVLKNGMYSAEFPLKILELVNLKYLELCYVSEKIPSSISRLSNLQTLMAICIIHEQYLPCEIWEMPQLRHIVTPGFYLPDFPDVQSKGRNKYILKNLQTLRHMLDSSCTQEVLTRIPNLKELSISYTMPFHSSNNIFSLRKLESLQCEFYDEPNDNILPNNFFPISLKKLVVIRCRIPWEQLSIIGVLPNLEVLQLEYAAMVGTVWETNDGGFMNLRFLLIAESDLVEWNTEKDHFPSLKWLRLEFCRALEAIPSEVGEIPTLEILELESCSRAAESSAKKMLGGDSDIELKIHNTRGSSSSTSDNNSDTIAQD